MRQPLHVVLSLATIAALAIHTARAESPIYVTKLLYRVPRTAEEVAQAHEQCRSAALQLGGGSSLDDDDDVQRVSYDVTVADKLDRHAAAGKRAADNTSHEAAANSVAANSVAANRGDPSTERSLPYEYTRRGALCFGTQMSARDQAELPLITSGAILDRVNTNYVSLQVRVHREAAGGEPYLHYRPEAAVGVYGKPDESIAFAALQQNALRDVRGLGLFVKRGEALSPGRLRTLVIVNKGQLVVEDTATGKIDLGPSLELMFVRARPRAAANEAKSLVRAAALTGRNDGAGENRASTVRVDGNPFDWELHAFATSGDRRKLHYLKPFAIPEKLDDCGIQSTVRITEYQLAGQYPSARAARQIHYRTIASLSMDRLDKYAAGAGWSGDALDNLPETLDAIIDGKVTGGKPTEVEVTEGKSGESRTK